MALYLISRPLRLTWLSYQGSSWRSPAGRPRLSAIAPSGAPMECSPRRSSLGARQPAAWPGGHLAADRVPFRGGAASWAAGTRPARGPRARSHATLSPPSYPAPVLPYPHAHAPP